MSSSDASVVSMFKTSDLSAGINTLNPSFSRLTPCEHAAISFVKASFLTNASLYFSLNVSVGSLAKILPFLMYVMSSAHLSRSDVTCVEKSMVFPSSLSDKTRPEGPRARRDRARRRLVQNQKVGVVRQGKRQRILDFHSLRQRLYGFVFVQVEFFKIAAICRVVKVFVKPFRDGGYRFQFFVT